MGLIFGLFKPVVEKYEEEFKTDQMKKRHVYHEIFIRAGDPEEVRLFVSELLYDHGYKMYVNKLTKFEELEEDIFVGGRLKPVRGVIKGVKKKVFGLRFPRLWAITTAAFLVLLLLASIRGINTTAGRNMLWASFILLGVSIILWCIKRIVWMYCWVKIVGIYDVERASSDLKVIIAADVSKRLYDVMKQVSEEVAEIYDEIGRKYVKHAEGPVETKKEEVEKKSKQIINKILETRKAIEALDNRFAKGEISEETYKKLRKELEDRLVKYETVLEVLS